MSALTYKYIFRIVFAVLITVALNVLCQKLKRHLKKKKENHCLHKVLVLVVQLICNISIICGLAVGLITDFILYHPNVNEKAQMYLQQDKYEELTLQTSLGTCAGWFYHAEENPNNVTIILYQGNTQSSADTLIQNPDLSTQLMSNLIITDYPGYGKSQGIPSEYTLKKMALMAFDEIMERTDMENQQIVIMGYSLGTGIANYIASEREVDGLILIAPYANGYDLFEQFFGSMHGVLKRFIPFRMESELFAKKITVSTLIIASKADELIPYQSTKQLAKQYENGCTFLTYENLKHGEFWQVEDVWTNIYRYLERFENHSMKRDI